MADNFYSSYKGAGGGGGSDPNAIDGLTGDVTATGPGTVAATVNTVGGQTAADVATATSLVNGSQSGNKVLASPANGASGAPAFRTLATTDLSDVSATAATVAGDTLTWDGSKYVPKAQTVAVGASLALWPTQTAIVTGPTDQTGLYTALLNPTVTGPTTSAITVNASTNGTLLIDAHQYNTDLGVTSIPSGSWEFNIYASVSNTSGTNTIDVAVYKSVAGAGTVTVTGSGTTRTVTSTTSMFVSGDYNASIRATSYVQLPGGFFPVAGYTSATVVTITTPSGYVNDGAGSAYRVARLLFNNNTVDLTSTSALLYQASNAQAAFAVNTTDRLTLLFFGITTANGNRTITYYQDGSTENTNVVTPLAAQHNVLLGLQGGTTNEYYHLTSAEHTQAQNAITALTGDVTATGPGSVASTIANLAVTNAKIANSTIDLTTKVTGVLPVANGGAGTQAKETFTLSGTDITHQYIDLAHVAVTGSIFFEVQGGGLQLEGASYDYSVSYTGGSGGNTRISFLNGLATGGVSALVASDVVQVSYTY